MMISNQSNIAFQYNLPDGQKCSDDLDSNAVTTKNMTHAVTKVKSGDKTFLREGETSVHTVVVTNGSHTKLFHLTFKDTMSDGASYVDGSVTVNGVSEPTYDPAAGFALPDLEPGHSVTVAYTIRADDPLTETCVENYGTVEYKVDDPGRGKVCFSENTNTVKVRLISTAMTIVKSVDKSYAVSGDTLHYTSVVTNTGTMEKCDLFFTDPIPAGTTFVVGSVKIDGVSYPTYDPQAGFALPDLAAGAAVSVQFDVTVN